MPKRPRGKFNLPRFSDLGPLVSYHNTPASNCDRELCFNGLTKEQAIKNIADAFEIYEREAINVVERETNLDFTVVLTGSVVRGDFGCRKEKFIVDTITDLESRRMEDDETTFRQIVRDVTGKEPELVNQSRGFGFILDRGTTDIDAITIYEKAQDELSRDGANIVDTTVCSDIDSFVAVEAPERRIDDIDMRLFDKLLDNAVIPAERSLEVNMGFEPQTVTIESLEEPFVTSSEAFNDVIDRFY